MRQNENDVVGNSDGIPQAQMIDRLRSVSTIVYVCLVFRTILVATLFDVLSPVLPLIGADLGVSQARFQAFFSATLMVGAAVFLGAPWLVDHIGRLRAVTVSAAAACLLGLLSATAQSYLAYAVVLLAMFAVNAIGSVGNRALMRDLLTHERYKKLFAYGQAALEATSIVAPLAAGWLAAAWVARNVCSVLHTSARGAAAVRNVSPAGRPRHSRCPVIRAGDVIWCDQPLHDGQDSADSAVRDTKRLYHFTGGQTIPIGKPFQLVSHCAARGRGRPHGERIGTSLNPSLAAPADKRCHLRHGTRRWVQTQLGDFRK
ncbi:MFS transporter [Cupriavidus necator]|nr:MFS transporter [Cupriavidus necator]